MTMRRHDDTTHHRAPKAPAHQQRSTTAPAQPWNSHRAVWMLASLTLPSGLRYGYTLDPTTRTPKTATITAADGSWADIDLAPSAKTAHGKSVKADLPHSGNTSNTPTSTGTSTTSPPGHGSGSPSLPAPKPSG